MTALDQPQISTKSKKILHSSYTGQKWSIFINYISDLLVTDIMVGTTGFEPATPTPPARNLGGSDRIAMHLKNLA